MRPVDPEEVKDYCLGVLRMQEDAWVCVLNRFDAEDRVERCSVCVIDDKGDVTNLTPERGLSLVKISSKAKAEGPERSAGRIIGQFSRKRKIAGSNSGGGVAECSRIKSGQKQ